VPPGRPRGCGGRKLPLIPNLREMAMRRRMKMRKRGEITLSPHSPPPEDLPSLGYLFIQQAGISIGARQLKRPQTGTGASSGPPP
jgi:hypothetical protein